MVLHVNLILFLTTEKPTVKTRPFYQEERRGRPFFLPLDVDGTPSPSFQWFRNGYALPGQTNQVLVLPALDEEDQGTYTCEIVNVAGRLLWLEATLHVVDE